MEIYISIDGVLRNLIEKFRIHYEDYYLNSEAVETNQVDIDESEEVKKENLPQFEYGINEPVRNDDLMKYFKFQTKEEFESFLYFEYALEIFGHSSLNSSMIEINRIIFLNKEVNFTFIGLNEFGKASASTLFFLSKNGFLGKNIKFITSSDIEKEWKKCDVWITDNMEILNKKPKSKKGFKFNTEYNRDIPYKKSINNLTEIKLKCLQFSENTTT